MKKILIIFLTLLVICATFSGCGKTEIQVPDYKQELLDLGFSNPEQAYSTVEIPIWNVGLPGSVVATVMRTVDGNWIYDPNYENDLNQIAEICSHPQAFKLVGLVDNANTLTFRVHVKNVDYYGYSDWKLIKEDNSGGGVYDFYQVSSDEWNPRMSNAEWDGGGYIPDISMETIRKLAAERFKDDPYGQSTKELPNDSVLSTVWNFEKGELIE